VLFSGPTATRSCAASPQGGPLSERPLACAKMALGGAGAGTRLNDRTSHDRGQHRDRRRLRQSYAFVAFRICSSRSIRRSMRGVRGVTGAIPGSGPRNAAHSARPVSPWLLPFLSHRIGTSPLRLVRPASRAHHGAMGAPRDAAPRDRGRDGSLPLRCRAIRSTREGAVAWSATAMPKRSLQTGIGAIEVRRPRMREPGRAGPVAA